jgi:uncharacterized protein
MKISYIDKPINYDGSQLRSHWIYDETGIQGDTIVAFSGACEVNQAHMVDLVDLKNGDWIKSSSMLHFIVEHFDSDLEKGILRQHLLVCLLSDALRQIKSNLAIIRRGDDLYINDCKLTVSIATASPISTLIHTGINISSDDTPVPTKGLNDLGIKPEDFYPHILELYRAEITHIEASRCKVRGTQ